MNIMIEPYIPEGVTVPLYQDLKITGDCKCNVWYQRTYKETDMTGMHYKFWFLPHPGKPKSDEIIERIAGIMCMETHGCYVDKIEEQGNRYTPNYIVTFKFEYDKRHEDKHKD